jgi:hypothetical protein
MPLVLVRVMLQQRVAHAFATAYTLVVALVSNFNQASPHVLHQLRVERALDHVPLSAKSSHGVDKQLLVGC